MANLGEFLDKAGVVVLWNKIKSSLGDKVDKVTGKGLSTNDYDNTEKSHVSTAYTHSQSAHAPANAEKNIIVGLQKNGTDLTVDATTRRVNITVPTKTSELSNDSGFITSADVPEGASASNTEPLMDGTAAVGTSTAFARGDHRHPTDTSRATDSEVVHLTGDEEIFGLKQFSAGINVGLLEPCILTGDKLGTVLRFNGQNVATQSYVNTAIANAITTMLSTEV